MNYKIERLLGWLTVSFGASFMFPNTGPAYSIVHTYDILVYAMFIFIANGFSIIYYSYGESFFTRLGLMLINAFVWGLLFITVVSGPGYSPFGPVAALCVVMTVYAFMCSGDLLKRIKHIETFNGEERRFKTTSDRRSV